MILRLPSLHRPFMFLSILLISCGKEPNTQSQVATSATSATSIAACDHLAADPDDPQKKGRGVTVNDLDLEKAIEACVSAVEADPGNIRLRFQLGRVLVAGGHDNQALPFLQEAADKNYPAALAYIGDLQKSDEAARPYFQKAAKGNYAPAAKALDAIDKAQSEIAQAKPQSGDQADAAHPPAVPASRQSEEPYYFTPLMKRIYRGDLAAVPDDPMTRAVILSMWAVFNDRCGERNPFLVLKMMTYGGVVVGLNSLGALMSDASRSDLPNVKEGLQTGRVTLFAEPADDAALLMDREGCRGPQYRQFIRNYDRIIDSRSGKQADRFNKGAFSELVNDKFRRELGLPDPAAAKAINQQAERAFEAKDYARARELHDQGCKAGNARSCESLGIMFAGGLGGPQDKTRARELLTEACPRLEGLKFFCGEDGLKQAEEIARNMAEKAGRGGESGLPNRLAARPGGQPEPSGAAIYKQAERAFEAKDYVRARALHEQACKAEDAKGCTELGLMFAGGIGGSQDKARARELLGEGCQRGDKAGCSSVNRIDEIAEKARQLGLTAK